MNSEKATISRRQFLKNTSFAASTLATSGLLTSGYASPQGNRPNILWLIAEDASPHIGCYGETLIETPNLDRMAKEGVRFENAFVTCPVCSPSRSAMITGMYQTTLGAHNHRSQTKRRGIKGYKDSYHIPVESVPELFRQAGYYVTNSGRGNGKTDYNFLEQSSLYDKGDWSNRKSGQPFFAQVQMAGGKWRGGNNVDPDDVELPPYYPDHPVMRRDWARYLNSWVKTDRKVGSIIERLRKEGTLENTVIFFWTDHGISHVRGKQFLYDEGVRVPMLVRFGDKSRSGTVRSDLVEHIDIPVASLALAGIDAPDYIQGRDIFAGDYQPRKYIFTSRDRCDETTDHIRSVRSKRYKYIRNFMSYLPHAQPNQYKLGKKITKTMRKLYEEEKLNELQSRVFRVPRPVEELYDLESDPYETVNLADNPKHSGKLKEMRTALYDWMKRTRDVGLIPEPILEDLGRTYGNKYKVLQDKDNADLVERLIKTIEAGEKGQLDTLRKLLESGCPSEKYWAATWLGNNNDSKAKDALEKLATDEIGALRVAALLALCKLESPDEYLPRLIPEITNDNLIVGMYAMNAIEQTGLLNETVKKAAEIACESDYGYTRRIGRRLNKKCD